MKIRKVIAAMEQEFMQALEQASRILIGIGSEWSVGKQPEVRNAYEALSHMIDGKDYFIVTTLTDGFIFDTPLDAGRITAPCGNRNWRQCSKACTKDIWEAGEVPDDICPHCGEPLTGNTIAAETYIEEGYLPQWQAYTTWLTTTLNRPLLILELGESFQTPTVIRWPFEKTAFLNKQAVMYRVNASFPQVTEELKEKIVTIPRNSCELFLNLK